MPKETSDVTGGGYFGREVAHLARLGLVSQAKAKG